MLPLADKIVSVTTAGTESNRRDRDNQGEACTWARIVVSVLRVCVDIFFAAETRVFFLLLLLLLFCCCVVVLLCVVEEVVIRLKLFPFSAFVLFFLIIAKSCRSSITWIDLEVPDD